MRILLVALNARYVHTNLAVRYLREILQEQGQVHWEIVIKEFSINDHLENIAAEIYEEKPDIVGFSCYIWNISQILTLLRRLRLVLPQAYFVAGGPEVSFEPEKLLSHYPQLDAVVIGEGETSFPALIQAWSAGQLPWNVPGLAWRFHQDQRPGTIFTNEVSASLPDLNGLPNPYALEEDFRGRLVYVETSRGCPFSCQFCISSTFQGIRYLEPEKFRLILRKLFSYGARTIKFVDRTFNARKKHAFRILDVFKEEAEKISTETELHTGVNIPIPRAHCEMAGELLDQEWLEYLKNFPEGMIQLEIGVQSTYQPALEAVKRPQSFALWEDKVRFLQHDCNIPVHLDLIAGLPMEGWQEFRHSFEEVFAVRPSNLQLGFLKVLKGSGIWKHSKEYGLVYSPDPPYTILKTRELSHGEILELVRIEEVLEKYYNSGRFKYSLEYIFRYILKEQLSTFDFFYSFAGYWQKKGWFKREWNPKALFQNLWEYLDNKQPVDLTIIDTWREALRFDYYLLERPGLVPEYLESAADNGQYKNHTLKEREKIKEEIKNNPCWQEMIPEAQKMDKRQWARATAVDYFSVDIKGEEPAGSGHGVWYLFYYGRDGKQVFKYNNK